jgi:hypothetical protein
MHFFILAQFETQFLILLHLGAEIRASGVQYS